MINFLRSSIYFKSFKHALFAFSLIFLTAFSAGDQIQLELAYNARSTFNFLGSKNIAFNLPVGTRAKVLEIRTLSSGNSGVMVELGSKYKNRKVWLYDWKDKSNDLKLCKDLKCSEEATTTSAIAVETLQDQDSYRNPELADQVLIKPIAASSIEATDAQSCNNCSESSNLIGPSFQAIERVYEIISSYDTSDQISIEASRHPKGQLSMACNGIMSPEGQIGPHGEYLVETMLKPEFKDSYYSGSPLGSLCPKFSKLSTDQKTKVWTWFWASLAQEESGCKQSLGHGLNVNPALGYGYWTVELGQSRRSSRPKECRGTESFIKQPQNQAACSVAMMSGLSLKTGKTVQESNSYWGPLRSSWAPARIMRGHQRRATAFERRSVKRYEWQMMAKMKRVKECF